MKWAKNVRLCLTIDCLDMVLENRTDSSSGVSIKWICNIKCQIILTIYLKCEFILIKCLLIFGLYIICYLAGEKIDPLAGHHRSWIHLSLMSIEIINKQSVTSVFGFVHTMFNISFISGTWFFIGHRAPPTPTPTTRCCVVRLLTHSLCNKNYQVSNFIQRWLTAFNIQWRLKSSGGPSGKNFGALNLKLEIEVARKLS